MGENPKPSFRRKLERTGKRSKRERRATWSAIGMDTRCAVCGVELVHGGTIGDLTVIGGWVYCAAHSDQSKGEG